MGNAQSIFRFTGACVGNSVCAGNKILGLGSAYGSKTARLCKSTLSAAGKFCGRVLPNKRATGDKSAGGPSLAAPPAQMTTAPPSSIGTGRARLPQTVAPPAQRAGETAAGPHPNGVRKAAALEPKTPRPRDTSQSRTPIFTEVITPGQVDAAQFSDSAQKVVFKTLLSDLEHGDIGVRSQAADALSKIRHELSVRALAAHFFREPSAQLRKECVNALVALDVKEGLPVVKHALRDSNATVRLAAVMRVYRLAGARRTSMLLKMLNDENIEVRRMVACCVGWMGQKHLAGKLVPLLSDEAVRVRLAAVEAMGSLGDSRIVSTLLECLNDSDGSVRKKVLAVLERITGKRMDEGYPENEEERDRLLARWHHWWKRQVSR